MLGDKNATSLCRAVGRSENSDVLVVVRWAKSVPLVEIGLTDLPKSECAMAHPAHPGMTGLPLSKKYFYFTALRPKE